MSEEQMKILLGYQMQQLQIEKEWRSKIKFKKHHVGETKPQQILKNKYTRKGVHFCSNIHKLDEMIIHEYEQLGKILTADRNELKAIMNMHVSQDAQAEELRAYLLVNNGHRVRALLTNMINLNFGEN